MATPSFSGPRLRLADHVRACCADGQVILLDLRRNRYVGVGAPPSLAGVIEGWPATPDEAGPPAAPTHFFRMLAPLLAQGLVTDEPKKAGRRPGRLETPGRSLNADDAAPHPPVGWRRAGRFHRSAATASLRLRCQSLAGIADAVATRRASPPGPGDAGTLELAQEAVAVYQRLRLFAFSAHDRCLHDALTLVGFLAAEGIAAHWVIGVRTRPFGAHSWAQIGDTVLNDQHEQVRRFAPILVA
jgi:hypothetical protein